MGPIVDPRPMGAIISITAKLMVIVDKVLGAFVMQPIAVFSNQEDMCNIPAISANLTPCGQALVDQLTTLIYYLVQMGGQLLPALGVVPITT